MEKSHKLFKPHTDLILFASYFSKNYRLLNTGMYFSNEKNYMLNFDTNAKFGASQTNVWRIEHLSHIMQVSIDFIQDPEVSADFVFFMIIWSGCLIHYKKELRLTDFERADKETMQYYKTTGRSVKNIVKGYVFIFKKWAPSDAVNRRLKWVLNADEEIVIDKTREFSYDIDRENKTVTFFPLHLRIKIYNQFLDGKLKSSDIKINDFFAKITKSIKEIYIPKGFKVYFAFKKEIVELS